ncbi:DUF3099 domain-containing protein [Galbitalea soli]|uniref:DUF3099 domain-containing protein n=1 Tax=Galbitalea soli TaxID=1268042 RepID=A0A7C9TPS6_9MICO|nr:DUF3099 domain-containing protein [Galbitalea soli]NEM90144.1 DUF3099 domain-containing protein [Galbitalea soli]NYJ30852.1 hypothetical protein [Galbitalea soli]
MKKSASQSVTSLPPSPNDERRTRMIKYSVAMAVRVVCVVLCFFVKGWWLLLPIAGAVILPYIAVVLANTVSSAGRAVVVRPGAIVPVRPTPPTGPTGPIE